VREIDQRNAPSVRALVFSDDGTLLLAGGQQGVAVWDMANRVIVRVIEPENDLPRHVGVLAISPDNGMIAFSTQTGAVLMCPTFGDHKSFALVAGGCTVDAVVFSDPVTTAVTFAGGSMRRWNVRSGRERSAGAL